MSLELPTLKQKGIINAINKYLDKDYDPLTSNDADKIIRRYYLTIEEYFQPDGCTSHAEEKNYLIACLEKDGKTIGKQASEGNELAEKVIKYYTMWYACPGDNAAYAFTQEAYNEWRKQYGHDSQGKE